MRVRAGSLCVLLGLAGCVTHRYETPAVLSTEALFRADMPLAHDRTIADLPWQSLFSDAKLRALIAEGLAHNLDLKIAMARIEQARANLAQSRAAFAPDVAANANYAVSRQLTAGTRSPRITVVQVGASASWELDLWGKLRSQKRAAEAALEESWAYRNGVQTQLVADIANAYYALIAYDRELVITEEALRIRIEDVETVKALKQGAVVTGADVVQSEANRYAAEVALPDIKRDIRETEHALSILLARPPRAIERATLEEQAILTELPLGVPAALLANRPDVRAAEMAFRSAFELTNAARTYFYPALTLTGAAGSASRDIGGLFGPGTFIGNVVGGLTQPLFNRGLNRQRLRVARAQQEEALDQFRSTFLRAGQEVSNALFAYQMAAEKAAARAHQLEALGKAVEFTKALLRYTSSTNYVDVLTAEQSLLSAQISAINDRLQQLQAVVNLYRALGGGWRAPASTSAPAPASTMAPLPERPPQPLPPTAPQ